MILTCVIPLLLVCIVFAIYDLASFRRAIVTNVSTMAEIVGNNSKAALYFRDPKTAEQTVSALQADPAIDVGYIFDSHGELFARYDRNHGKEQPLLTIPLQQSGHSFKGNTLRVYRPIFRNGEAVGTVYVEANLNTLDLRLRQYALIGGIVFLIGVAVTLLLSARLQKVISDPILDLVQTARSITRKRDYSMRASCQSGDELGTLVESFNEMLSQVQIRDAELQKAKDDLEQRVKERTQELANSLSLVQATLDSTDDGILVTNGRGKVTDFNEQFVRMWGIPKELLETRDEEKLLEIALTRIKEPEAFLAKVRQVYEHPDAECSDFLEMRDGKLFERTSKPQRIGETFVGRVWSFRDVTEERRAEIILRQTEEVYRQAIAGAGAVPYSYDYRLRRYVFIDARIEELTGYKSDEITPELWKRIIKETIMLGETAGLDKAEAAQRVVAGEIKYWRCDMRIVTREGRSRWLSDASVQNVDSAGHATGSIGILQDITERKQAEISAQVFSRLGQQLSSAVSARQAADIINLLSDQLLGWDAFLLQLYSEKEDSLYSLVNIDTINGKRTHTEPSAAKKPTELHRRIVRCGAELILREDTASFLEGAEPFGSQRPSASLMFVPVRSGSRVVGILSIQSYTPHAYDRQDLQVLQTFADQCGGALERIWSDEARKNSEAQFRAVWNTSADGMRLCTRDGTVLKVNDAYCRMVGKPREELEGTPYTVIHSDENKELYLQHYRHLFETNAFERRLETEAVLWDGRKLWFDLSNSLLQPPGQAPLLLSIFRDISQRKQAEAELQAIHRQLVDASRQAGMAEVATGVLHNVGNVLNSVNVSASIVAEDLRHSKASKLTRIAALLKEHENDLGHFFSVDPRGHQLAAYLISLSDHVAEERRHAIEEMDLLRKNIEHIKDIVAMQQSYAKVSGVLETVNLTELVEDALDMNAGALARHRVRVIKEYGKLAPVTLERHKVLQILVNLIRNAKYACDEGNPPEKVLKLCVADDGAEMRISVTDNGIGIPAENLTRIFNHGFTTRPDGHGFGLHSGALAAKELGGFLTVDSEGIGKGATFVLHLPHKPKTSNQNN